MEAFLERARAQPLREQGATPEAEEREEASASRVARIAERESMNEGLLGMIRLYRQPPRSGPAAPGTIEADQPTRPLVVGPEAEWFEFDGKRADLRRRRTARRMLEGLLERRQAAQRQARA